MISTKTEGTRVLEVDYISEGLSAEGQCSGDSPLFGSP